MLPLPATVRSYVPSATQTKQQKRFLIHTRYSTHKLLHSTYTYIAHILQLFIWFNMLNIYFYIVCFLFTLYMYDILTCRYEKGSRRTELKRTAKLVTRQERFDSIVSQLAWVKDIPWEQFGLTPIGVPKVSVLLSPSFTISLNLYSLSFTLIYSLSYKYRTLRVVSGVSVTSVARTTNLSFHALENA